ncbi:MULTISPECIES: class I SAM-dependent methyltransferase [Cysteiniphilum]|uniref:class I SAM-dependent methyltransferase n=1 Tax=Cysteiniphilum TaxID=2056696 RepID=UPI0017808FCC|nr:MULTISPECIES: class I SAM-dependent methyltransferase [Cysteiniphilum]
MATIHTAEQYANIYKILQKHDNSKQIIDHITKEILPTINCNRFLDIGAGEGKITKKISPHFNNTLAIEPNPTYASLLKSIDNLTVINQTFQEVKLTEQYNFILCSHVLYHVDEKDWDAFALKAYKALAPGGVLMFVVPSNKGEHYEKCISYNPQYKCYKLLKAIANKHRINYRLEITDAFYNTTTLDEMYQICRFSILEDSFTYEMYQELLQKGIEPFNADVMDYAKRKYVDDDHYSLIIHPAFISFHKPL